jgi:pimeloyl-ACP methyl ester carboxylesterase
MRGELDTRVPARVANAAREGIRTAQLTLVPNAGHLLTRDQPDQIAETIARFVKAKQATGGRRRGNKARRDAAPPPP